MVGSRSSHCDDGNDDSDDGDGDDGDNEEDCTAMAMWIQSVWPAWRVTPNASRMASFVCEIEHPLR